MPCVSCLFYSVGVVVELLVCRVLLVVLVYRGSVYLACPAYLAYLAVLDVACLAFLAFLDDMCVSCFFRFNGFVHGVSGLSSSNGVFSVSCL